MICDFFPPFMLIWQENRNKIHQAVKINSDALSCVTEKLQKVIELNCKVDEGQRVIPGHGRSSNHCLYVTVQPRTQVLVFIWETIRSLHGVAFSQTCPYSSGTALINFRDNLEIST